MKQFKQKELIDEEEFINNLIPNPAIRETVLLFLLKMIQYADGIDKSNWCLNLSRERKFLRFNTGHEYCITVRSEKILILTFKEKIKAYTQKKILDISYVGHKGKGRKESVVLKDLNLVPDSLSNVPGSIGCLIKNEVLKEHLSFFEEANKEFIDIAIRKTKIRPRTKNAHSEKSVEYLIRLSKNSTANQKHYDENEFQEIIHKSSEIAKSLDDIELNRRVTQSPQYPPKVQVTTTQFIRNQFVSESVKRQANGICHDCNMPAPFISKRSGEGYLETHHITPLSEGGKDIIENVIALCPNCHRKRHYG